MIGPTALHWTHNYEETGISGIWLALFGLAVVFPGVRFYSK